MLKFLLIGCISALTLSCKKHLPEYPKELNTFHMILIPEVPLTEETKSFIVNVREMPRSVSKISCLEFEVVKVNPYQFDFKKVVDLVNCHEVGGYKADENIKLWNWVDDVFRVAEENKCFSKP